MPGKIERAFGRRLRELRGARGLTQARLSETCELSTKYLGSIERGEQSPTLNVLQRLAIGLGVDLHELVRVEPETDAKILRASLIARIRAASDDEVRRLVQLAKITLETAD